MPVVLAGGGVVTYTGWLDETLGTPEGRWVKRLGGVRVFIPADKTTALNPANQCEDCGGFLLPNTRCDTCLTWAVKNARDAEWARISWANRGVIWDVLGTRKSTVTEAA